MAKSCLAFKISICESIERLHGEDLLDATRAVVKEIGWDFLKKLLIKQIVEAKDIFTSNSLTNIEKEISGNIKQDGSDEKSKSSDNNIDKNNKNNVSVAAITVDLISYTSLFLNEHQLKV